MRGKHAVAADLHGHVRIIPAHAGQTTSRSRSRCPRSDHPRACGANPVLGDFRGRDDGSSPRMRGKRTEEWGRHRSRRIIPAHAGQTTSGLPGSVTSSDHPRACGANVEMHASLGSHAGSSPRVRGKLRYRHYPLLVARIIPAHAGQTCCRRRPSRSRPDHPRACGANSFTPAFNWPSTGSSPRMRGKLREPLRVLHDIRIIPAHAGQTSWAVSVRYAFADHPRACGANLPEAYLVRDVLGSSPRMRGKRHGDRAQPRTLRIIPAHAGQTPSVR